MATPHINAPAGAFAETVLMPGDPLRAKHIAETFLEDAVCVNTVRNMFGYTGTYKGKKVSVLGSGMGVPSMSIYATELVKFYDVKNIIRIGSCGALPLSVKVRDVVIGMGASTDSMVNRNRVGGLDFAAMASFGLLEKAVAAARAKSIDVKVGNVFTSDLFYNPSETLFDTLEKYGVLAVEMEAAGLYGVAAEYGINALAIFTVSDHIRTGEALSAELRQTSFNEMVEVALGCL
ncbi:purine-nucleoside phosphorylase [Alishewanella sp. 16-MA]|uniref:Purine nucleoside phosphorylase DeoD-type n=1 Tax=Alishewanella maricola TaxID=2795740 RepID=A0ABS8C0C1_9ALTE|nr:MULTISPECIES: purine-nucleoside phosphorylase [Gammaproteobacteria]MDP5187530.1 purine-nucleoside phosphorylase [Alishewanella sp.]MDP5206217.1 purine-nucleoside phosphorylase [Alishewanella sp. SMS9]MCB5225613.1 purine-nucleoside phosphorylase [Alishewanella maricola]MCC5451545.1 purine-nucleoside phosphorylase [Rheinheimera sp. UJ51]MCF4008115.1 purine-nucleoside phosphorylase [Rheinheimera sp. UJ63]